MGGPRPGTVGPLACERHSLERRRLRVARLAGRRQPREQRSRGSSGV